MKKMKATLLLCLALPGCAALQADVAEPVQKVAEEGLPRAGEALEHLKTAFFLICGTDPDKRSDDCNKAKDSLNQAIDLYTQANKAVIASE